jgi:transcriptional regulator with XRE-family HTH domain
MPTPSHDQEFWEAAGRRLKAARLAAGETSVRGFAKKLSVTHVAVLHWEKGDRGINDPRIWGVLRAELGITLDWLFNGDASGMTKQVIDAIKKVDPDIGF